MKKITSLLFALTFLLTSCTGDQGPPGFDGAPGIPADEYAAQSFEVSPINFQYDNDTGLQEAIVALPYDILDSDVVLVYRLDEVVITSYAKQKKEIRTIDFKKIKITSQVTVRFQLQ